MLRGRPLCSRERLATFSVAGVDDVETAWNDWVADLFAAGLRPADEPHTSTDDSMTFRLFPVESWEPSLTLTAPRSRVWSVLLIPMGLGASFVELSRAVVDAGGSLVLG